MFDCKMILASVAPHGKPVYTVQCTYPRFIHAEIMTHRDRARNAASSRAIPWKRKGKAAVTITELPAGSTVIGKGQFAEISLNAGEIYEYYVPNCMFSMIMNDPVIPIKFGLEQKGMQTGDALEGQDLKRATEIWLKARDYAVQAADELAKLNVHKSICNRLVEPWMFITVLMTATEWKNFFRLRCHPMAEIHFQKIAGMIRECISSCEPKLILSGDWHLPFIENEDYAQMQVNGTGQYEPIEWLKLISSGRCARLSYLTHEGKRDHLEDIRLANTLIKPPHDADPDLMHASPFEHVVQAVADRSFRSGPIVGYKQFRKEFANENVEG